MRIQGVKNRRGMGNWRPGPGETYIGRPGPFGNPYAITRSRSRDEVLDLYEIHLRERLQNDGPFREQFRKLDGQTLVCWCVPEPVGPEGPKSRPE